MRFPCQLRDKGSAPRASCTGATLSTLTRASPGKPESSASIPPMSPATAPEKPATTLGWKEYVDLPQLDVFGLKAKVDTGARTSALHVESLVVTERHADGTASIEFEVPLDRKRPERRVRSRALMLTAVTVTDSGGRAELRPVIETELVIGPVSRRVRLTLTDRTGMLFRLLLGRKALEGDFLIDVGKKYLSGRRPRARSAGRKAAS